MGLKKDHFISSSLPTHAHQGMVNSSRRSALTIHLQFLLPFNSTAARLPALIADCTLIPVEGGPHNIGWTHADEVNAALLAFLGEQR